MKPQNYELANQTIHAAFNELKRKHPERLKRRLNLSWSNWGFGLETLAKSAARLSRAGIKFVELHGNHYGPDLGYKPAESLAVLGDCGVAVSGICGMFSDDNDLSSNRPQSRQAAIDYLKREIDFAAAVKASYVLVVPGAVGRPKANDDSEFERSVDTLRLVADRFVQASIRAAIEPIRSANVSLIHTYAEARHYIAAVDHPGVQHINGDVFHMQTEERHIGTALIDAGERLLNLHMADSNRRAMGDGSLDLDTIIAALYVIGHNVEGRYVTFEPLGPGSDTYRARNAKPDSEKFDRLVSSSVSYFRERETTMIQG